MDLARGRRVERLSAEPCLTGKRASLFEDLCRSVSRRRRFSFTAMDRRANGSIGFAASTAVTDWWLNLKGEPFKWGPAPDHLGEFLFERGDLLLSRTTHAELRAKYPANGPSPDIRLAAGEVICLAEPGYSTSRPNQR
jgi:hypothetical protein